MQAHRCVLSASCEPGVIPVRPDESSIQVPAVLPEQSGEQDLIEASILAKRQELELKIHQAERELRRVRMKRRERLDALAKRLQNINSLLAPAVILCIGVVVGARRRILRSRHIRNLQEN